MRENIKSLIKELKSNGDFRLGNNQDYAYTWVVWRLSGILEELSRKETSPHYTESDFIKALASMETRMGRIEDEIKHIKRINDDNSW